MSIQNRFIPLYITLARVILSPVFLTLFLLLEHAIFDREVFRLIAVVCIWVVFLLIGTSDLIDGAVARRYNMVSDAGKVIDPLADVLSHITYFICFVYADILWVWLCVIIIYRELMIIGVRMLLALKGVSFPAGKGGKLKTILFACATAGGLITFSLRLLSIFPILVYPLMITTLALFVIATVVSYVSFVKYVIQILKKNILV